MTKFFSTEEIFLGRASQIFIFKSDGQVNSDLLGTWDAKGSATVKILCPTEAPSSSDAVCQVISEDQEKIILSFHLVHPETVLKSTEDGKGNMLWVQEYRAAFVLTKRASSEVVQYMKQAPMKETCLEIIFDDVEMANRFQDSYTRAQRHMSNIHATTKASWSRGYVEDGNHDNLNDQDRESLTTDPGGDDSSEVSEISLSSTDSEKERIRVRRNNPGTEPINLENSFRPTKPLFSLDEVAKQKSAFQADFTKTVPSPSAFSFGVSESVPNKSFSFGTAIQAQKKTQNLFGFSGASNTPGTTQSASVTEAEKVRLEKKEEMKSAKPKSPYPPMETMKKVDQVVPGGVKNEPKKSAYPPMETMRKVEQLVPGNVKKELKKSTYPPMETMKKVAQIIPGKKQEAEMTKNAAETMKKVDQDNPSFPLFGTPQNFSQTTDIKKDNTFISNQNVRSDEKPGNVFNFASAPQSSTGFSFSSNSQKPSVSSTFGSSGFSFGSSGFGSSAFSLSNQQSEKSTEDDSKEAKPPAFANSGFSGFATSTTGSSFGDFAGKKNIFK